MLVFLKRLPLGTRRQDIEAFLAKAVKGGLFSRKGRITNIVIIERRNPQNATDLDYHGIVAIEPDNVGVRVIKTMNRKRLNNKYIEVRCYYIRKASNDPRHKASLLDETPNNRRRKERRQTSEEYSFTAVKDFHRKG